MMTWLYYNIYNKIIIRYGGLSLHDYTSRGPVYLTESYETRKKLITGAKLVVGL